ncbi:hypothetical protein QCN29_06080 [Streptomyces sp. HNM0663]|uniref:Peptidase inhibitor family I36 n=1 Tax=Streptomyces chengmaiensis TaxID=3040919 RepID=A0ABT6HJ73_9ACTN|nr:hypothetical protein [Streptomyces chengmaiensis]MDH2388360.1 hypothetical protein [Streptomyces chengmaiensis]
MHRTLALSAAVVLTALAPALASPSAASASPVSASPVSASAASASPTSASASAEERGPGEVCFWTEPGQHGSGWCYRPPGYADVPASHHDKTASFRSDANRSVYAIDWGRNGCHHRLIRPYDFSDNWSWGSRIDGVADTTMGCEAA